MSLRMMSLEDRAVCSGELNSWLFVNKVLDLVD